MSARKCNECSLCCKLLPVRELAKGANTSCKFQRSKGCRVYRGEGFPYSCGVWSCGWLLDETLDLPRPDRSRYVIDPSPEFIEINGQAARVVQIWCDPRFPTAHRDPALRAWLSALFDAKEQVALERFDSQNAIVLFPPQVTGGEWYEQKGTATTEHSAAQIFETLKGYA